MTDVDAYTDDDGGLVFYHPVDDAPIDETFLPWGTVAPGSSADTRLRVKNLSADNTAQAVTVAIGGPADPAVADGSAAHYVSADGAAFAATVTIGDLAPAQTSDAFTLRRVTPPDAGDGDTAGFTLTATAAGWQPAAAGDTTAAGDDAGDTYDPDAATPPVDDDDQGGGL